MIVLYLLKLIFQGIAAIGMIVMFYYGIRELFIVGKEVQKELKDYKETK